MKLMVAGLLIDRGSVYSRLLRLAKRISARKNESVINARFLLAVLCLLLVGKEGVAQEKDEGSLELGQSCETAVMLSFEDASFTMPQALGVVEVGTAKSALTSFHKELNLSWHKFIVPEDILVGFEIRPMQEGANLDFVVFKADGKKTCSQIENGQIQPIRKNLSKAGNERYALTGLSVENNSIRFNEPIETKKGEEFYLVVNNVYGTEGHQLRLKRYTSLEIKGTVKAEQGKIEQPVELIWLNNTLDKVASSTKTDVAGNFVLQAIVDETDFRFEDYELIVSGKGFKLVDTTFNRKINDLSFSLASLAKGKVADSESEHLYFRPNSAEKINDESQERLERLLKELRFNPRLKVQLEGHSNGVYPSTEVDSKLSYTRAESVKDFLVERGVERHRVFIKAFGSSKQLYPKAKNEEEESKNRRVEIRYIDF